MPDPNTDTSQPNGGLRPDQIDPAYGALTRGMVYSGNPLLTAQPPAPAPAPAGYARPQSTYSSPFVPQGQTPQIRQQPYYNTDPPPVPPPAQSGTTTSPNIPPSGAGTAGATTGGGLLMTPNLATNTQWPVDWLGESLPFRERWDDMWRAMPPNLWPGVQIESAHRTEEQQRQLYDDPTAGGPGHVVARPGPDAPHVKGIAADLKFVGPMGPAAEQWIRTHSTEHGLAFPLPNTDPNHLQLTEHADQTKYDVPLLQRTMYRLESDSGRDPKTKIAFDPNNPDAAVGPAQIKMETFREFARPNEDINNPQQNLDVGYRALAAYYKDYGGDMNKALLAYRMGKPWMDRNINTPVSQMDQRAQDYLNKAHKLWNDGAAIDVLNGTKAPPGTSDAQARADALAQQRISTLQAGLDALTKQINAADPTSTAVLDLLRQNQEHASQLQRALEERIFKPPQPQDYQTNMFGKFGSLATVIGIFGGLLARAPLTASLGAAASAMDAINQGDYDRYKDQFKLWDTQVNAISKALALQHSTYSEILQTAEWTDREKWERIHEAASLFQDQATLLALEQGNAQEIADRPYKLQKQQADLEHVQSENREIDEKAAEARVKRENEQNYGPLAGTTEAAKGAQAYVNKLHEDLVAAHKPGDPPVPDISDLSKLPTVQMDALRAGSQLTKSGAATKVGSKEWLTQQAVDDWASTADRNDPKNWSGGTVGTGEFRPPYNVAQKLASDAAAAAKGEQPWPQESMDMLALGTIYGQPNALSRLPRTGAARNQYETTVTHALEEKFGGDPTKPSDDPANKRARELGNSYMMVNQQRVMAAGAAARSGANAIQKINTASAELDKAAELVVEASEKVPRTELYDFNRLIEIGLSHTGDANVVQLGLAINNLYQAYGRLANPFGTASHVYDKELIQSAINIGLSKHQMKGAVDQVLLEGANLSGAAIQGINRTMQGLTPLPEGAGESLPGGTDIYRAVPAVPRQYLPEDQPRVGGAGGQEGKPIIQNGWRYDPVTHQPLGPVQQ